MSKPYLIKWESINGTWNGKAIVLAHTPIEAWNRYIKQWNKDYELGNIDLNSEDIDSFSVEVAADGFIGEE